MASPNGNIEHSKSTITAPEPQCHCHDWSPSVGTHSNCWPSHYRPWRFVRQYPPRIDFDRLTFIDRQSTNWLCLNQQGRHNLASIISGVARVRTRLALTQLAVPMGGIQTIAVPAHLLPRKHKLWLNQPKHTRNRPIENTTMIWLSCRSAWTSLIVSPWIMAKVC